MAEIANEEAPKKSKLPLIIIGAVVVLALAAGGAWFFLKGDDSDTEKEKAKAKASAIEAIPVYMPIDTLTVNLKDSRQYLQLTITLQLKNGEDSALIKLYMPQVRSRALIILASKKPEDVISSEGKLALLEELKTITEKPFTEKLEPIMPILKGIGYAVLAILSPLIALAGVAAFTALAAIPIVGPVLAPAAALGAISFLTTKATGIKISDGMIDSKGGLVVSGEKGTYKLDENDSVVAGTGLNNKSNTTKEKSIFDKIGDALTPTVNVDLTPLIEKMDILINAVRAGGDVYLDATKVGTAMNVGTYKVQ